MRSQQNIFRSRASVSLLIFVFAAACAGRTPAPVLPMTRSSEPKLPTTTIVSTSAVTVLSNPLDLREANVLGVDFEELETGLYRFDVTLIHDDDGESPRYADRWVVEDLDGNPFGERILLHAHGNLPFTRSATLEIPEGIKTVVVRGHDQLHGFGGQALELDLHSGQIRMIDDVDGP
jgi:hypothetical protein